MGTDPSVTVTYSSCWVSVCYTRHLEAGTSCSEAQSSNRYLYVRNTYDDEDQSDVDDALHLGQRQTAALKEAEVNGCSCCCAVRTLGHIWRDKMFF